MYVERSWIAKLRQNLCETFPDIAVSFSSGFFSPEDTPTLMVDCQGRFFLEGWDAAPRSIGSNPNNPTAQEIGTMLNLTSYLQNYYQAGAELTQGNLVTDEGNR